MRCNFRIGRYRPFVFLLSVSRYDPFRKDEIIYNCYTTKPSSKCSSNRIIHGYVRDAKECLKKLTIIDTETATRASTASEQRRTTFRITLNTLTTGDANSRLTCEHVCAKSFVRFYGKVTDRSRYPVFLKIFLCR